MPPDCTVSNSSPCSRSCATRAGCGPAGREPSWRSRPSATPLGAVTATAYAGRAPYDPTAPVGVLLAAGVLITGTAAVLVLARTAPARRVPDPGPDAGKTPLVERTGR